MMYDLPTGKNKLFNETIDFEVPQWDNVICTLRYDENDPKRETGLEEGVKEEENLLPAENIKLEQTCGYQYLSMYDTVTYDLVGKGPDGS